MSLLNKIKKLAQLSIVITSFSNQINAEEISKAKEIEIKEKAEKNNHAKLEDKFEEKKYSIEDLRLDINDEPDIIFKAEESEKRIRLGYEFDKLFFGTDYFVKQNIFESKLGLFTGLEINNVFSIKLKLTNDKELTNILVAKTPRDSYFCLSSIYSDDFPCFKSIYFEKISNHDFILGLESNKNNVETSLSIKSKITKESENSFILDHNIVNKLNSLNKKDFDWFIDSYNLDEINDLVGNEFLDFSFDINCLIGKKFSAKSIINLGSYSLFNNIILNSGLSSDLNINFRINNGITTELYKNLKVSYQCSFNNKLNIENIFLVSYSKSF